nr:ATP-binding protein [Candidatus Krumholzibacteria bacterium]
MGAILGRDSLLGIPLETLLVEENKPLPLPRPGKAGPPLTLNFLGPAGILTTMLCTVLRGDQGFTLLAENPRLRDDQILGKMSRLSNEIAVISSDLARSKRQLQRENRRASLMHRHEKLSTWDLEIKSSQVVFSSNLTKWMGLENLGPQIPLDQWVAHIHPEDLAGFNQALKALKEGLSEQYHAEYRLRSKSGQWGWFSLAGWIFAHDQDGNPLRLVGNHLDITEEKWALARKEELIEKVNHKLKIETVGVFTSGIIHNLNNNLSIILGSLDLAESFVQGQEQVESLLSSAKTAVYRSRDTIAQVLGLGRSQEKVPAQDSLGAVVEETLGLLPTILPETITLESRLPDSSWTTSLMVNSTRIQEAVVNLCTNAIEAMGTEGRLSISLDEVDLAADALPEEYVGLPGRFARLSVQDTGTGIPESHLDKIFSLFFTCHPQEEGTGLGLATVKKIMEDHGGLVQVESKLGEGSTFHLLFPRNIAAEPRESQPAPALARGLKARILMVDDMPDLAELGREILVQAGFETTALYSSQEVLDAVRLAPDRFDLVITDQSMPGISGLELIAQLQKVAPALKFILISGLGQDLSSQELEQLGIGAFCHKPVPPVDLVRVVREVLEQVPPSI